jgi:hypothetical protein
MPSSPPSDDEVGVALHFFREAMIEAMRAKMEFKRSPTSSARINLEDARWRAFQLQKKWFELEHPGCTLISRTWDD